MNRSSRLPRVLVWAIANLVLLILALLAWAWLDYRYINEYWAPEEMGRATDWLVLGIGAGSMAVNLWLLRSQTAAAHLLGALATALATVALWWLAIALAGSAFHTAIGGTAG